MLASASPCLGRRPRSRLAVLHGSRPQAAQLDAADAWVIALGLPQACGSAGSIGLGQGAVDALCAKFTAGVRAGRATEAFCEVIAEAGAQLAKVLPRKEDDTNELSNRLVVLD